MKRMIISLVVVISVMQISAWGQSFTYYPMGPTNLYAALDSLVRFQAYLQNDEPQTQIIVVQRESNAPPSWWVFFCFKGSCFPDPIMNDTLAAFEADTIDLEVTPKDILDSAWVDLSVSPLNNPSLVETIRFYVNYSTGIEKGKIIPNGFSLLTSYPNPFNASVSLRFALEKPGQVNLAVFNLNGREVGQVYQGEVTAGEHRFDWQPGDLASGVYLVRLQTEQAQQISKILYLR